MEVEKCDDIYKRIGEFGNYQLLITFLIGITASMSSITSYSYLFIGGLPKFRCKIASYDNDTFEAQNEFHQVLINSHDECLINSLENKNISKDFRLRRCSNWVYSKQYYDKTIVTEIRKKKISYVCVVLCGLLNVALAVLVNINDKNINQKLRENLFGLLRFLIGVTSSVYVVLIGHAIEMVGPKYRVIAVSIIFYFFNIGGFITVILSAIYTDFRENSIAIAVLLSIFGLYFWIIPESPRYLHTREEFDKSSVIFAKIADSNKKQFYTDKNSSENKTNEAQKLVDEENSVQIKDKTETEEKKPFTWIDIVILFLVLIFNWSVNSFIRENSNHLIEKLSKNPYIQFVYAAITELMAVIFSQIFIQKLGRNRTHTYMLLTSGFTLFMSQAIPAAFHDTVSWFIIITKFFITITINCVCVLTLELCPTERRITAFAICSAFSRIVILIVPYILEFGATHWKYLPYFISFLSSIIAVLVSNIILKETKDVNLPDTYKDMD